MTPSMPEHIFEEAAARRLIGWQRNKPEWGGTWDYFAPQEPYRGVVTMQMKANPLGLRPLLTRQELIDQIFRGPKLVQRMQAAGWIKPMPDLGTKESLFRADEAMKALDRLFAGERPPPLPSERPDEANDPV
jgi:hypothetical protein